MISTCASCQKQFEITHEDLAFYDQISPMIGGVKQPIPPPKKCPQCRLQNRLAFRNERKLYHRKSDLSGKEIISIYSQDKPYKVYDQEEWWSDQWNGTEHGRDFDFSKSFSEQFKELYREVPHMSLYTKNNENSYYTNFALNQKNSYLIFGGGTNEDCMFGKYVINCKDSLDNLVLYSSELCYEGVASEGCYNCKFLANSRNCTDCFVIEDCQACKNCIGCFGLRNKEYYVFNEFVGKEKYQEYANQLKNLSRKTIEDIQKKFSALKEGLPHVSSHIFSSENCSGDAIFNSKNCNHAFDIKNCEDCKFISFSPKSVNTYDSTFNAPDGVRNCYNVCSTVGVESSMTTFYIWYGSEIFYSIECHNCNNIFGCTGLKNKQYCILNKQYTKEEYEEIVPKIIKQMRADGEWGEYFPLQLSPFAYNETIAQEYFPLNVQTASQLNLQWKNEDPVAQYTGPDYQAPETIQEVTDEIIKQILRCDQCTKHYKIIAQELAYYRKNGISLPAICPDCRHKNRLQAHKNYDLWTRNCSNCQMQIQSIYSSDRPETLYCEKCYLKAVY